MPDSTTDAKLQRFKTLLNKFEELNLPETEFNLFQVGTRGHFENPTTELLSFFLDPAKAHKLDDSFFTGLQSVLFSKKISSDSGMLESVETEVSTESGKRIDLLLETDNTLILVECKIYHNQNNPFDDYTTFGNNRIKQTANDSNPKNLVKLVLCLDGNISPSLMAEGWHGISYNELVQNIEPELSKTMLANPYNKWVLFAREFLLHLKEFNTMSDIDKNEIEFLTGSFREYTRLSEFIYDELMPKIGMTVLTKLNQANLENFIGKDEARKWNSYEPVRRFSNANWMTGSDINLCLRKHDKEYEYSIIMYLNEPPEDMMIEFENRLSSTLLNTHNKEDSKGKITRRITWNYHSFNVEQASDAIVELMRILNSLELKYRPQLLA